MSKRRRRKHERYLRHNKKADVTELSQQLAPLEEIDPKAARQHQPIKANDTIIVDSGNVSMRDDLLEEEGSSKSILRMEPVVLVILVLMLLFIAYIAYEVQKMPAPTN